MEVPVPPAAPPSLAAAASSDDEPRSGTWVLRSSSRADGTWVVRADGQTRESFEWPDVWPEELVKLDLYRCSQLYAPEGTTLQVWSHDWGWHKVTLQRLPRNDDDRKDDRNDDRNDDRRNDDDRNDDGSRNDDGRKDDDRSSGGRNDDGRKDEGGDGRSSGRDDDATMQPADRTRNDEGNPGKDDDDERNDRSRNDDDDDRRRVHVAHAEFAKEIQMAIAKSEAAQVSLMMPPPSAVPQRPAKRQRLSTRLIYEHAKSVHLQAWAKQVAAKLMETAMQAKESALVAKNCINFFEFDSQFDEPSASATNLAVPRRLHV